jgi:hypothetical protein
MGFENENQIGVEIIADVANAEVRVEEFQRTVAKADRAMSEAGKTAFGEDLTSKVAKVEAAIARTAKMAAETGIAIDRSYTQGAQAAKGLTDATQAAGSATDKLAKDVEAAQIPIVRAYEQSAEAARKYVAETERASKVQGASSLPPITPLTPEQRRERSELQRGREQSASLGSRGILESPFEDFTVKAGEARQRSIAAHEKQAALAKKNQQELNNEVEKSSLLFQTLTTNIKGIGSPLAGITSGILGANAITAATGTIVEFGTQAVDVYQKIGEEQRSLINTSAQFGRQIREDLKAVESLRAAGLFKDDALSVQKESIKFAEKAGQADRAGELARRATDYAAANDISEEKIPDLIRTASTGRGIEEITGKTEKDIYDSFRGRMGISEKDFNETLKSAAKLEAFIASSKVFNGEQAKKAASEWEQFKRVFTTEGILEVLSNVNLPSVLGNAVNVIPQVAQGLLAGPKVTDADIDLAQKQSDLQKLQGIYDDFWAGVALKADAAAEAEVKAAEKAAAAQIAALQNVGKETDNLYSYLNSKAGRNNPFVQIFSEADQAARRFEDTATSLRKNFGAAADEVIAKLDDLTRKKRDALSEDGLDQRFTDRLTAQRYRQEAATLRSPQAKPDDVVVAQSEQTARAAQGAERIGIQTNAAPSNSHAFINSLSPYAKGGGMFTEDGAFIGADSPFNKQGATGEQLDKLNLLRAQQSRSNIVGDVALEYAREKIPATREGQLYALERQTRAGNIIGSAASLYSGGVAAQTQSSEARNAREAIELTRKIQSDAVATGVDPVTAQRIADKHLLETTKGIDDPAIKRIRADALDRQAGRTEGREDDARKIQEDEVKARKELKESIDNLTKALKEGGGKVEIEILDKADAAKVTTLGGGFQ